MFVVFRNFRVSRINDSCHLYVRPLPFLIYKLNLDILYKNLVKYLTYDFRNVDKNLSIINSKNMPISNRIHNLPHPTKSLVQYFENSQ